MRNNTNSNKENLNLNIKSNKLQVKVIFYILYFEPNENEGILYLSKYMIFCQKYQRSGRLKHNGWV